MEFEKSANLAVEELTKGANFQLQYVNYDEKHFGNAEVFLTSSNNLKIRFLLDRGEKWCEVGRSNDEWFTLDDVLGVLGIKYNSTETEFIDWVNNTSKFIKSYLQKITSAFDDLHYTETQKKLKTISTQRMLSWFNQKKV